MSGWTPVEGWTPVDEGGAGWTPVEEGRQPQSAGAQDLDSAVRLRLERDKVQAEAEREASRSKLAETGLGALSGMASIGNTALTPIRAAMDYALPNSLVAKYLDNMAESNTALKRAYDTSNYFGGGEQGAEIAATLPVGGALAEAGRMAPLLAKYAPNFLRAMQTSGAQGGSLFSRAAGAATTGAAQAGLVDPHDAALGALAAPVTSLGLGRLASAVKPTYNRAQQLLLDEGVRLTPGQLFGGVAKRAEDLATSVPLLGDMIRSGQKQAVSDLNRAAANRALAPVGESLPNGIDTGHDLINYVEKTLGDKYAALTPRLTFKTDPTFSNELLKIQSMAQQLPDKQANRFNSIIRDKLVGKMTPQGNMNGESFKQAESELGRMARGYSTSQDFDDRQLGDALASVVQSARDSLLRTNPQHAGQLSAINNGWANFTRLQKAAGYVGTEGGEFTPAQLQRAVRDQSGGVRKGQFARGSALMQDLSDAGKEVLPSKINNSGTVDRALGYGLLAGSTALSPHIPMSVVAGAGLYSPPGAAITRALLTQRPEVAEPLANMLRKYSPQISAASTIPLSNAWAGQSPEDND